MPLSENEQRLLEQMERALYAEDPKFASALQGSSLRERYRRRALIASVGFVAGVALLMTGLVTQVLPVSILGFVVMLGTAFFAVTSWRDASRPRDLQVVNPVGQAQPTTRPGRADRRDRGRGQGRGRGAQGQGRGRGQGQQGQGRGAQGRAKRSGSFMQRLEERWDRRRNERGF